jgi:transcriptional regulator GlxA family with amidase domain
MATTSAQPFKVLLAIHYKLDALDFIGPLEIFSHASFTAENGSPSTKAFQSTITAQETITLSSQGVSFSRDIDIPEAHRRLSEFDVLVIPGGGSPGVLESKSEPLALISAFAALPRREDGRPRILLSVCTGSLFLASQGVLGGLTAVTHPNSIDQLKTLSSENAQGGKGANIVNKKFVVNQVNQSGMRIITSGGISCGLDASLWLVEHIAGRAARERVEKHTQYEWRQDGFIVGE